MLNPIASHIRRLAQNDRGIAAVEFAMIVPVLVILLFGAIETTLLVQADRRVNWAANTMADLTSRVKEVGFCGAEDVFAASSRIIRPDTTDGVQMRISAIGLNHKGEAEVVWSQARNSDTRKKNDVDDINPALIPSSGEVILAEVTYDVDSTISFFFPNANIEKSFFMRPRDADQVTWKGPKMAVTGCEHMSSVAWAKVVGS